MGYVVLAGLFEPGTQVKLYQVASDRVMRVETEPVVGHRLADASGSVGFDGLEDGARFIARGFDVASVPLELRCRALSSQDGSELAQEPIRANRNPPVGTQEKPAPERPVGEPDAILHVGVPAGLPLGVTTS